MSVSPDALERWTCESAIEMYGIREWSGGLFDVSPSGEIGLCVQRGGRTFSVSLPELVSGLKERGLTLPVLLRFGDILHSRITLLNTAFREVMTELGYKGKYRGVYPIKVNQQQQVVEDVMHFGRRFHFGLEAGSKAELIAALAFMHDPEGYIVCNGYKDEEFIDLALYAQKMGVHVIVVLEMPGELSLLMERADRLGVKPCVGIRVKLSSKAGGRWTESGGDRSVFGLNPAEVIDVVDDLKARGRLGDLQMLHYHLGSQIPNISHIRSAVHEAARFYVDLVKEGAAMGILDIGGGLAVDYDGSHTNFASSSNYGIREYCADVVEEIMATLDEASVAHPTLITESGRAITAHASVLLFNILQTSRLESHGLPDHMADDAPEALRNLLDVASNLSAKNLQEVYHDAVYYRDEIRAAFLHGDVSLRCRATGDQIFWHLVTRIAESTRRMKYVPEELQGLEAGLADVYYANLSVFQSLPDTWAIEQLFPIVPIHRLNERPSRMATISDITCDCDGKIDKFIDLHDVKRALPLHELKDGEDYVLGAFLVGAYQETLGDLHNLFGDTNVVSVHFDEEGELDFSEEIHGDSVADVLSYVEYDPKALAERVRMLAERAVRSKRITATERREILDAYSRGLQGYTYFES